MSYNLTIIGAGNMGSAIMHGLMNTFAHSELSIADPDQAKLAQFSGIKTSTDARELIDDADAVLIAVKPQSFDNLSASFDSTQDDKNIGDKLIISIMAGKTIGVIAEKTGSQRVIRTMPNLGAQVGEGMTAWIASDAVSNDEKEFVRQILLATGKELEVENEGMIDAFTATVGCGPAYFFLLTEMIQHEAQKLGFTEDDARLLAEQTCIGSAKLLQENDKSAQQWREAVTSKGGVTEAALGHLFSNDIERIFGEAIQKALERNKELS